MTPLIFPTMITAYKENGSVDYDTLRKYVYFYEKNGCDGIFSVCQSSEIFFLSDEEIRNINKTVWDTVCEIEKNGGKRLTVVSSGHTAYPLEEQAKQLCALYETGTDALILITNRLDPYNEGDDVFIRNAEKLLKMLPPDAKLGFYECPYPYKRLLTPRILRWCVETGRFYYSKDTCCDAAMIKDRLEILKGSNFRLLNANCQTLLRSIRDGGSGYCGIMCNFHPRLYRMLADNIENAPLAEKIQNLIGTLGFIETGLPYPQTAKYHMTLEGIPTVDFARNGKAPLSDYAKDCVRQLRELTDNAEKLFKS